MLTDPVAPYAGVPSRGSPDYYAPSIPAGAITQLALPGAGSNPDGIAAGPARTIWVTETGTDSVLRITLSY